MNTNGNGLYCYLRFYNLQVGHVLDITSKIYVIYISLLYNVIFLHLFRNMPITWLQYIKSPQLDRIHHQNSTVTLFRLFTTNNTYNFLQIQLTLGKYFSSNKINTNNQKLFPKTFNLSNGKQAKTNDVTKLHG